METITKKCNKCKKALSVEVFGDNGKGECFKTCDTCRAAGRDSKARVKFEKDKKDEAWIEKTKAKAVKSTGIKFYDEDKWALMTCEALDVLSYEEKKAIPINLTTVVSMLNIEFINEKIIKYCGDDVECKTIMDTGIIRVWLPEREGYFRVRLGDTWAKVRENIHCC